MTVPSVAVATTKFLFGMCDSMADSDVGMADFSLVLGILCVCGHVHCACVITCVSRHGL